MKRQTKVLVVDDSVFARELIIAILSADNEISIIGEATNGREALEKVRELKPDIVTMDIEMPVMDGFGAIEHIMATNAVPILVVTSRGSAKTAYAAISKGALDLIPKPEVSLESAREFIDKVKLLSKIKVIKHIRGKHTTEEAEIIEPPFFKGEHADRVVAIASSTGGPAALSIIMSQLYKQFPCPIVIAQHIWDGFVLSMVEWLTKVSKVNIKVAEEGEFLTAGTAYVAPSERHMEINDARKIVLKERQPKDIYRPSCDILLTSVAQACGTKSVGVILTGMGNDGAIGMKRIKQAGGTTIAQDEGTSVVFGMPRVAIESGCIDRVLPIDEIGNEITRLVSSGKNTESNQAHDR